MIKTHKIKYDTSKYQFRPLIKKILGEKSLENLHEVKKYERYKIEFSQMNPHMQRSILSFIRNVTKNTDSKVFALENNKRFNEFKELYDRTLNMGED